MCRKSLLLYKFPWNLNPLLLLAWYTGWYQPTKKQKTNRKKNDYYRS